MYIEVVQFDFIFSICLYLRDKLLSKEVNKVICQCKIKIMIPKVFPKYCFNIDYISNPEV